MSHEALSSFVGLVKSGQTSLARNLGAKAINVPDVHLALTQEEVERMADDKCPDRQWAYPNYDGSVTKFRLWNCEGGYYVTSYREQF